MKVLKRGVTRKDVIKQNWRCEEKLSNGKSVTKAILMGSRACCGSSFVEKVM